MVKYFTKGPEIKFWLGRVFFNWEKQLFAQNPGQDWNYHTEHTYQINFKFFGHIIVIIDLFVYALRTIL